jgi:transcriptional regulator with XRE-family HTH domain
VGGGRGKNSKSFDGHIGGKLRELREAAKISQSHLGKAIGVSFQQIQKYESGRNRMSAGQLWLLCEFLNVPIASMFDGTNLKMFQSKAPRRWLVTIRAPHRAGLKAKK